MANCSYPRCPFKATGVKCHSTCSPGVKVKKVTPIAKQSKKAKEKAVDITALHKNDGAFYLEIWQERPHIDFETGEPITEPFSLLFFHHVLPKKKSAHEYSDYSRYRHCKWNIVVLNWANHTMADKDLAPKVHAYKQKLKQMHEAGLLEKVSPNVQFIK